MDKLKNAFETARKKNNIGWILPEFLASQFFAIGLSLEDPQVNGKFDFARTKGPQEGEMCVTVSQDRKLVTFEKWGVKKMNGRALLRYVPQNCGILISYNDGGDYLTQSQISTLLSILD